ncbi:hypothetical protein AVEN_48826-1 [Araneus ventricosus]|uniref:Uncharacterized protein n=1 Tax=Araneus ventricosus TaxID=182803 RepID=A0A4Y2AG43_ARAVE|nr:hypothetical protein AVEN_48826-1 [Araneus ventricosus]
MLYTIRPLTEPPDDKLRNGFSHLENGTVQGKKWEPCKLDNDQRLYATHVHERLSCASSTPYPTNQHRRCRQHPKAIKRLGVTWTHCYFDRQLTPRDSPQDDELPFWRFSLRWEETGSCSNGFRSIETRDPAEDDVRAS